MIATFSFIQLFASIAPILVLLLIVSLIWIGSIHGMPITKMERAKAFVDVLDMGIKDGHSPEHVVVELSKAREQSFGVRFHLLAAHVENDTRLGQALEKTPKFLPYKIRTMLRIGEETGLLPQMLIACRKSLADAKSQTIAESNYLLPSLMLTALLPFIFFSLAQRIWPVFVEIGGGMGASLSPLSLWILNFRWLLFVLLCIPAAVVLSRWIFFNRLWASAFLHGLYFRMPWRYVRMQRDFAGTLSLLLDAGLPEEKALDFASEATGNKIFRKRVQSVIAELRAGLKLTDAVARLDTTGEFQWRLQNAAHCQSGFTVALSGWIEALDAKAFQQEQTASHFFTSGLVLLNAVAVGLIAVGLFQVLIGIINAGVLW